MSEPESHPVIQTTPTHLEAPSPKSNTAKKTSNMRSRWKKSQTNKTVVASAPITNIGAIEPASIQESVLSAAKTEEKVSETVQTEQSHKATPVANTEKPKQNPNFRKEPSKLVKTFKPVPKKDLPRTSLSTDYEPSSSKSKDRHTMLPKPKAPRSIFGIIKDFFLVLLGIKKKPEAVNFRPYQRGSSSPYHRSKKQGYHRSYHSRNSRSSK